MPPFSLPPVPAARPPRRPLCPLLAGAAVGCALALAGPAWAGRDTTVDDAPPADASAEGASPAGPDRETPAAEAPTEGIWAWIHRLEGEVLTDEVAAAVAERAEVEAAEREAEEVLSAPSVPTRLYDDPEEALTVDPLRLAEVDPSAFDIPIRTDPEVQKWMRYFLGSGRKHFQRYLDRSGRYLPLMHDRLEARGLPRDLVYLSMIESGFNPNALSHAGAGGLWQFMPATGRMYDLRVDWWVDDRRDPVKSTEAAVAHLADLHRMFNGDWLLAWCAYNAGPGRVRGAMRRAGTDDFWKLARGNYLPRETANYPPKLMAAAILSKNAERYGFRITPAQPLQVDTVEVEGAAALDMLAELAGIDVDALRSLNPGLRRTATPSEGYTLNLPSGTAPGFLRKLAAIPDSERTRYVNHTVQRGDTLSRIAARYGVDTRTLVRLNRLQDANRIVVGMSLLVPREAGAPRSATLVAAASPPGEAAAALDAAPGQTAVQAQAAPEPEGQAELVSATHGAPEPLRYTVRAGDTLSGIAARYGVSIGDLARWNRLSDPSAIRIGQALTVHRVLWRTYEVRSGDSLGRIAQRQGCSVDDLRTWNDLRGDLIHPGQTLRIRR